ncbi:MAG: molybdopterin-binding protein [Paracoccaceae bacterium]
MKFGSVPISEAEGAILAHSLRVGGRRLRKGVTLTPDHLAKLRQEGIGEVVIARPGPEDIHEDEAAERLGRALVAAGDDLRVERTAAFTGRVNLLARVPGVARIDAAKIEAFNRLDPMVTCATVPPLTRMEQGGMIATVKIISYAVPERAVAAAEALAQGGVGLHPVALKTASLIVTETGASPEGESGLRAIRTRLELLGIDLVETLVVPHRIDPIGAAIGQAQGEMILILTGSATSDPFDVGPEGLRRAGGEVTRFGMPVDPGNLLFLGTFSGRSVLGLPGCARSPALNGADWVLERLACGLTVSSDDIAGMGVGGLLKEIPQRPQPRRGKPKK